MAQHLKNERDLSVEVALAVGVDSEKARRVRGFKNQAAMHSMMAKGKSP